MLRSAVNCCDNARAFCTRFIDGDELARRLEMGVAPRLTPRMLMHKIQRACSEQASAFFSVQLGTYSGIAVSPLQSLPWPKDRCSSEVAVCHADQPVAGQHYFHNALQTRPRAVLGQQLTAVVVTPPQPQRIVLPEALDPRILKAAAELLRRGQAHIILLGQPDAVQVRL